VTSAIKNKLPQGDEFRNQAKTRILGGDSIACIQKQARLVIKIREAVINELREII
jgi:hypothetical protein